MVHFRVVHRRTYIVGNSLEINVLCVFMAMENNNKLCTYVCMFSKIFLVCNSIVIDFNGKIFVYNAQFD